MEKTDCTVAVFDVDGTVVNGNCSKLFIEFLSKKNILSDSDISRYHLLIRKHDPNEENYLKIAEEAFLILSRINNDILLHYWGVCFNEIIIPRFDSLLVKRIKQYQHRDIEVFLASGSPGFLIKGIAEHLNIPINNIIASSINGSYGTAIKNASNVYCIGQGKEIAINELFKNRNLNLDSACFYSDNLSDISLLKQVAEGYWAGSKRDFERFNLANFGIIETVRTTNEIGNQQKLSSDLDEYYHRYKDIIEESISSIFPLTCEQKVLDHFIGARYSSWDLSTMQKAYFDPVNEYLSTYDNRLLTIGACIFMEAGGLELRDYLPLLGIGELLNTSNEVFVDISNWTSGNNLHQNDLSHVEISVLGNASISLLSLPIHNIIHDRLQLDSETKLKLYEMYTSIVYHSLFGNGLRLYWEQQNDNNVSINEYLEASKLLNKGLFQFGIDLFQIVGNADYDQEALNSFESFTKNAALLVQLLRDKTSFKRWEEGIENPRKYKFNVHTNLIGIHACRTLNNPELFLDLSNRDELIHIFYETSSIDNLQGRIEEYSDKVSTDVKAMPFENKYNSLIESYTHQLVFL